MAQAITVTDATTYNPDPAASRSAATYPVVDVENGGVYSGVGITLTETSDTTSFSVLNIAHHSDGGTATLDATSSVQSARSGVTVYGGGTFTSNGATINVTHTAVSAYTGGIATLNGGNITAPGDGGATGIGIGLQINSYGTINANAIVMSSYSYGLDFVTSATPSNADPGQITLAHSTATTTGTDAAIYSTGPADTATITDSTVSSAQGDALLTNTAAITTVALDNSTLTGALNLVNGAGTANVTASNNSVLSGSANSAASSVTLQSGSTWTLTQQQDATLNDVSTLGALTLDAGTLQYAASIDTTLTLTGNYASTNGTLTMGGVLNGGPADTLIVDGDTSGATAIDYTAQAGSVGAATTGDGILVVQVNGNSAGTFALKSPVIVAGTDGQNWQYTLAQGMQNPKNWYLRASLFVPVPVPMLSGWALAGLGLLLMGGVMVARKESRPSPQIARDLRDWRIYLYRRQTAFAQGHCASWPLGRSNEPLHVPPMFSFRIPVALLRVSRGSRTFVSIFRS